MGDAGPRLAISRRLVRFHLEPHAGAFALEEPPLRFRASLGGVVAEAPGFRDHTVAGNDDDHRVSGARGPDRATRSGPPEPSRDFTVRDRLAGRDRPQELEYLPLEGRNLQRERNVLQIALSRVDMLEDPRQVRMVGSRGLHRRLPGQSHRGDAIPEDLELNVQAELSTELRIDLQGLSVLEAGSHP